jgi:hypothetical protein
MTAARFIESPVPGHERFQHVRDERHGIDCLAIRLRVQRRIAVEVGFQAGRTGKGQLDAFGLGQRPIYRMRHMGRYAESRVMPNEGLGASDSAL